MFKPYPWTGVCVACSGPSNLYDFRSFSDDPLPTRSTVPVEGTVVLADGSKRTYRKPRRIEVCYPCRRRWLRKGTFLREHWTARSSKRTEKLEAELRARLERGESISDIARAMKRPFSTVYGWLKRRALLPSRT